MTMGRFVFKRFCAESVLALKKCLRMWVMEMEMISYVVEILKKKPEGKTG